jgi:hypothetical protein
MPSVNWRLKNLFSGSLLLIAVGLMIAVPASAQFVNVASIEEIDSDLDAPPHVASAAPTEDGALIVQSPDPANTASVQSVTASAPMALSAQETYQEDDLIGAAEDVFGRGAQGLGKLIEDILKRQGQPNGYITGREGGGAFVVGLRYGSGTLNHKVEGQKPVYWTGPSIGPDAGANAGSTFILVYNLYDAEDIYKRFLAGEGAAYFAGGFNASYLRRGDVVLIPIRVGAGFRLGANVGYMRFSKKQRWAPF